MADRPILFGAPMVRAILDGRKTQTRRIIKPQPFIDDRGNVAREEVRRGKTGTWLFGQHPDGRPHRKNFAEMCCPYGVPGDRLWVRETWSFIGDQGVFELDQARPYNCKPIYRADGATADRWWPSIHMPRWASRITLEITSVRVQRLNDISAADALAEGMTFPESIEWGNDPKDAFFGLWEHLHGEGSWAANPWVWVVEFKRVTP